MDRIFLYIADFCKICYNTDSIFRRKLQQKAYLGRKIISKREDFNMPPIYLDNASTAYPKALPVADTVRDYILNTKCNVNG